MAKGNKGNQATQNNKEAKAMGNIKNVKDDVVTLENGDAIVLADAPKVEKDKVGLTPEVLKVLDSHKVTDWKVEGKVVSFPDGSAVEFDSKSQMFKYLYDVKEMNVGQIAKLVGARYQFVYGIISTHTNGEIRKAVDGGPTKSELFRQDFASGMTVGEIAKKYNANYTFVHTTIRKYKTQLAAEGKTIEDVRKHLGAQSK